jgi:hypothetical protein
MPTKYTIETVNGNDYVSLADAKKILGASSAADLKSLGSSTISVGQGATLWSVGWLVEKAKHLKTSDKFNPDTAWIERYVEARSARRRAGQKATSRPLAVTAVEDAGARRYTIAELRRLMPPPKSIPDNNPDWSEIEQALGVTYPSSFKEFIHTYGTLQWFDWLQPLAPFDDMTPQRFREYLINVFEESLDDEVVDATRAPVAVPEFGAPGGWLPFMTGSDGDTYFWVTAGSPESWIVVSVVNRQAIAIPTNSVIDMLAGWLSGDRTTEPIWGTVEEFRRHSAKRLTILQ